MRTVRALSPLLRRAGGRDARIITVLACTAFAVVTALALSVVGALLAFQGRAAEPVDDHHLTYGYLYVSLSWIALALLFVPLVTLGGAAARLGVARRDARLSALRLIGVTPREVVALTLVETAWQGLVGAVAGCLLYALLIPFWTLFVFQDRPFTPGELWVGPLVLAALLVVVPLLAAGSGAVSLRQVVVSPLGVSRRVRKPGLRAVRVVVAGGLVLAFILVSAAARLFGAVLFAVLVGSFAVAFLALNAIGPWVLRLYGRRRLRAARTAEQLLAARRLLDDPKAAWRVVGGVGLAGFVAGALALIPALVASQSQDDPVALVIARDLTTGGMLTLSLTFVVAAVSAGITQAASVLDRRREYALQRLAGLPTELLDRVRRREVLGPLVFVSVGSAALALVMVSPMFGFLALTSVTGVVLLVGCLALGCGLVLAATEASRPLLRWVLSETVVRAD
ncbi:FtsX-like permease family protein [Cellulomonas sp. URHB0016]